MSGCPPCLAISTGPVGAFDDVDGIEVCGVMSGCEATLPASTGLPPVLAVGAVDGVEPAVLAVMSGAPPCLAISTGPVGDGDGDVDGVVLTPPAVMSG